MASYRFAIVVCGVFGALVSFVWGAPAETTASGNDASSNFKTFSSNLLMESDLDEFSIEKGAAISSPFGVGYMLANIHDQVWNISNDGFEKVLKSPKDQVSTEYASLIEKLNKAMISTNSVLYVRDRNSSAKLPEGSQKLKTEMTYADFILDWKTSWFAMNDMIANQTEGKLNDQLVPKGGWWGGAFYPFTMSAYINTNTYKSAWAANWTSIGTKSFWDGLPVPFYQVDGKFHLKDSANYTAVAIPLSDKGKFAVFVLPKGKLVHFIRGGDLAELLKNSDPSAWEASKETRKIQVPALNITLLDQHFKKLETLGINHTFCLPDAETEHVLAATGKIQQRGPYFMSPIVQAHHIQFGPDFFQVASATGSSVNSEEKLKEDHAPEYDYGSGPLPDHGPVDSPHAQITELEGDDDETDEVVVPVVMDETLAHSLADGTMEIKGVDMTMEDPKTNETISAQGSSIVEVTTAENATVAALAESPLVVDATDAVNSDVNATAEVTTIKIEAMAELPTSTVAPEVVDKDTIQFSQPFFWYLHDNELGPLYYGTVHSLATYKKEYGLETDEDFWLFDAYKTLLWNCP